jgi:hypothetical protein
MSRERDAEIQRLFREKDGEIQRQMGRKGKEIYRYCLETRTERS